MKSKINSQEAVQLFSSPKKVFKTLDKTLSKEEYEFLIRAEDKGSYGIYNSESSTPIAVDNDVLKVCMGLLYFEYGVGKQDSVPSWSMPEGYLQDKWEEIVSHVETQQTSPLQNLNTFLDTGSSLYLAKTSEEKSTTVVLTNNFNENFAKHISFKTPTFSDGLLEANAMANQCLLNVESVEA